MSLLSSVVVVSSEVCSVRFPKRTSLNSVSQLARTNHHGLFYPRCLEVILPSAKSIELRVWMYLVPVLCTT